MQRRAPEGFLDGASVDEERIVLPLRLQGRIIGVLVNGVFQFLALDPRGTLLTEDGAPELATPYGVRARHPELAPALDYVENGYDSDLDVILMGLRDYDPHHGQFLSRDPAGFTDSVILYAAFANDPVNKRDPTGMLADTPGNEASPETMKVLKSVVARAGGGDLLTAVLRSPTLRPKAVQDAALRGTLTQVSSHPGTTIQGTVGELLVSDSLSYQGGSDPAQVLTTTVLQPGSAALAPEVVGVIGDTLPDLFVLQSAPPKVQILWSNVISSETGGRVSNVNFGASASVASIWEITTASNYKLLLERAQKGESLG